MNIFSIENFNNLWGDNYLFHSLELNDKIALVIVESNINEKDGSSFYLDFCTHNTFEEANETLYQLCFSNCNEIYLNSLLSKSGGGGAMSFNFYCSIISKYIDFCSLENKKRSCVNLLICNFDGMKKIIDFCLNKKFNFIGSCLSFRPPNYINILKRCIA